MQENDGSPPNRIVQFFSGKTILITGGSGFLGKVLIEKLLRCCNVKKIYVIVRHKKGKTAQERLGEILDGPLFGRVNCDKVEAISGEMSAPDLGLSPEDRRRLVEETEIVYHAAATVRFDDPLRDTILLNVRGTKLMLELAKECQNLLVFCHVSTAYCHENQEVLLERTYPGPGDPHHIISLCEEMPEDILQVIGKKLRGENVNNYTYSKALAEALVNDEMDRLPAIIQRPSVVIPIWREPLPGWTDNINGPAGLLIGAAKGVIRTMYAREDTFVDCVPVDIAVNALIISAFYFCTYKTHHRVYNVTASDETERMGITSQRILDIGRIIVNERVAFSKVLWYPNGSLKRSKLSHYVAFFFFQLLPALFVDAALLLTRNRPFLLKLQKRIWKGYEMLEYYGNRKWIFNNDNVKDSRSLLNSTEKEMFKIDAEGFDLFEYLVQNALACRRYMMKEPDEDLDGALRRMKIFRYLDLFFKFLFSVGIIYFIYVWTLK